jgi:glyoxylase-like metal-dependent hydrolase (beta-lactamase superfamily II)
MNDTKLKIQCLPLGLLETNCFIISPPDSKEIVLVDPGGDAPILMELIEKEVFTLSAIWLTHGHADHIAAVPELQKQFRVTTYVHEDDFKMLFNPQLNLAAWLNMQIAIDGDVKTFKNEDTLNLGSHTFQVIHTPGHTPGSACFQSGLQLVAGDTLFRNSIGRADFPGADPNLLIRSIKEKLLTLPDETLVYPGHGMETSIGHERVRNPFLAGV